MPKFDRLSVEPVHDRLAGQMQRVYLGEDVPSFLDQAAAELLLEGRAAFHDLGLDRTRVIASEKDVYVFTWRGTDFNAVLAI
ncbi:MAG: DEAD/DEAH box helicase, partial [Gammaproteobacteria bacterium]|nr:DEAD/DEAH box helicase [Gammaproteobacteria bacterium]NIV51428.1 DEAD/DEAH box helicase [Gammaproteobacteria bacterium]NIX85393.1 DEAD/DEAH box helicase [Gammaproteobacteria bacterium]